MTKNKNNYDSYLLRIWRVGTVEKRQWRITLEETLSGRVWNFPSLEALMAHLQGLDDLGRARSERKEKSK
jgi:hypothetical protein